MTEPARLNEKNIDQSGLNEMDATSLPPMWIGQNFSALNKPGEKRSCQSDPTQNTTKNDLSVPRPHYPSRPPVFRSEGPFPEFFNSSFRQSPLRSKMIALIWSFCCTKQFSLSTYYSSIAYLDMFFSKLVVKPEHADLVAVTMTVLAAKLNERKELLPSAQVILSFLPKACSKDDFQDMELFVVTTLDFNLHVQTSFFALHKLLERNPLTAEELAEFGQRPEAGEKLTLSLKQLSLFFIELSVKDYDFNQFGPATIALGCLVYSRACVGLNPFRRLLDGLAEEDRLEVGKFIAKGVRTLASENLDFFTRFRKPIRSLLAEVGNRFGVSENGKVNRSFFSDSNQMMLESSDLSSPHAFNKTVTRSREEGTSQNESGMTIEEAGQ